MGNPYHSGPVIHYPSLRSVSEFYVGCWLFVWGKGRFALARGGLMIVEAYRVAGVGHHFFSTTKHTFSAVSVFPQREGKNPVACIAARNSRCGAKKGQTRRRVTINTVQYDKSVITSLKDSTCYARVCRCDRNVKLLLSTELA